MLPGSIIACHGRGFISDVINAATFGFYGNGYSHVGILADYKNETVIFESTSLSEIPCIIQGKCVAGVAARHFKDMLDGYDGRVWEFPLAVPLTEDESKALTSFVVSKIGVDYDFKGAAESAQIVDNQPESISKLFCSEFVALSLRSIGRFPTQNVSQWNPNQIIRRMVDEGTVLKPLRLK